MSPTTLLVANRGEIAVRILRAAAELGIRTVAVYSEDDASSLHVRRADDARALVGRGASAYLDAAQIVAVALDAGADAVHPGYGFLSENADFAARCEAAGITFVGPTAEVLSLFGDKVAARALAVRTGVPVLAGTSSATSVEEAETFLASLGAGSSIMIKALAGGGGRGMRAVERVEDVAEAHERCRSEAQAAFGNGDVYVERRLARARHIEVQVLGDGTGHVSHLGERECSLQRRHQKIVEVAPAPGLAPGLRARLVSDALRMAEAVQYRSLGTFEFLVDADASDRDDATYAFIEANARLQVEHTVTEEVTGVDLVQTQLRLAGGRSLGELGLGLAEVPGPRGFAMQVRINMETMAADGSTRPTGGVITAFEVPTGPGLRTDTFGYVGYRTSPAFDSLLAKLISHTSSRDYADVVAKTYRALCEFKIEGLATNVGFLQSLLQDHDVIANRISTRFVDEHVADLVAGLAAAGTEAHPRLFFAPEAEAEAARRMAGVQVDRNDPLAVLSHGRSTGPSAAAASLAPTPRASGAIGPDGTTAVEAPMQGTVITVDVAEGDTVRRGQQLVVMEAMKMEHVISAKASGVVRRIDVVPGDTVYDGHGLLFVEESEGDHAEDAIEEVVDLDEIRPDLAEVFARHELSLDRARPQAVARRRKTGQRTTRENVEDLVDAGSFTEYAPLVVAAQRKRHSMEHLVVNTPGDGMVAGIGRVNGDLFDDEAARCAVLSYDYTVFAGTQGQQNHRKKDRLFELAEKWRLPIVFFCEGGGGRPGDTEGIGGGLDCMAFTYFGRLSGLVPLVGITSGRCFAGNAALLGSCDVVIATAGSNIGMGGPAMVEGGNLGVFRPEEIGPVEVQTANGVIDVLVEDEAEAVAVAKKYLSYFQGPVSEWECADQRLLRRAIPENRLRIYDVRQVIETMADTDSVLELRRDFGIGMVTCFMRVEGRPVGVIANNPVHLGGAIDSDGADKAARFMQLCDAYDIPILQLCDTPGMMVGPEVEATALVRHCCRLFVTGASVTVPVFTIVLRKGYGLGAQAMAAGSFKANMFTIAWPTGEFGGMGLEGAVKLGYRKELEAIEDPEERKSVYDDMVARMYRRGKAIMTATDFEIDDVIDPMESRTWITSALRSAPSPGTRTHKKRPCIDTW